MGLEIRLFFSGIFIHIRFNVWYASSWEICVTTILWNYLGPNDREIGEILFVMYVGLFLSDF